MTQAKLKKIIKNTGQQRFWGVQHGVNTRVLQSSHHRLAPPLPQTNKYTGIQNVQTAMQQIHTYRIIK